MKFETVYKKQDHSIGIALYHIEFCTKYRFRMFSKTEYKNLIHACIKRACIEHSIEILALNVMPEHVHLIVKVKISFSVEKLVRVIKGYSAYLFFRRHPKARLRYPQGHLWSRGKFIATLGMTDLNFAIDYVLHQEEKHSSSLIGNR